LRGCERYRGPSRSKDALRMTARTDNGENRQGQEQGPIRRFWLRQNDDAGRVGQNDGTKGG